MGLSIELLSYPLVGDTSHPRGNKFRSIQKNLPMYGTASRTGYVFNDEQHSTNWCYCDKDFSQSLIDEASRDTASSNRQLSIVKQDTEHTPDHREWHFNTIILKASFYISNFPRRWSSTMQLNQLIFTCTTTKYMQEADEKE